MFIAIRFTGGAENVEKGALSHKSQQAAAVAPSKALEVKASKLLVHIPKCLSSEVKGQTAKLANTPIKINSRAGYSFAVSVQKNSICMLHCFIK